MEKDHIGNDEVSNQKRHAGAASQSGWAETWGKAGGNRGTVFQH